MRYSERFRDKLTWNRRPASEVQAEAGAAYARRIISSSSKTETQFGTYSKSRKSETCTRVFSTRCRVEKLNEPRSRSQEQLSGSLSSSEISERAPPPRMERCGRTICTASYAAWKSERLQQRLLSDRGNLTSQYVVLIKELVFCSEITAVDFKINAATKTKRPCRRVSILYNITSQHTLIKERKNVCETRKHCFQLTGYR